MGEIKNLNFIKSQGENIILNLYIQPNSSKNEIVGLWKDKLKVKIAAPPHQGKANKRLIEFLSQLFKIKKSQVKILRGEKSREKVVEIKNLNYNEFLKYIGKHLI